MSSLLQQLIERLGKFHVMLVSVLIHSIIILIFAFTVFQYVTDEPPDFSSGGGNFVEAVPSLRPADAPAPLPTLPQDSLAIAPPPAITALATVVSIRPSTAFAIPPVTVAGPSSVVPSAAAVAPGRVGSFGNGSAGAAANSGGGAGGSESGGFGTRVPDSAKLSGIMYDLKQTRSRKPTGKVNYYAVIADFVESRFHPDAVKGFFRSHPIYTSHIFLPNMDAGRGPEAFGLEGKIAPSNWFIHYQGELCAPRSGRFRFWAMADDVLVAVLDGRVVIDVALDKANPGKWASKGKSFRTGYEFTAGDWMDLQEGKSYRLDLILGERPGGQFKAYLLIEREGEVDAKGGPARRLFTTVPLPALPANPDQVAVDPEPLVMSPRGGVRPLRGDGAL